MDVLDAIFTTPEILARMIAILFAALLAYVGIWYTQRQTNFRESKAHLRGKYEEAVADFNALLDCREDLPFYTERTEEELNVLNDKYRLSLETVGAIAYKLDMLLSIYAPHIETGARKSATQPIHSLAFRGHFDQVDMPEIKPSEDPLAVEASRAKIEWEAATEQLELIKRLIIVEARKLV